MIQHRSSLIKLITRCTLGPLAMLLLVFSFSTAVLAADLHLHRSIRHRDSPGFSRLGRGQLYAEAYDIYVKDRQLVIQSQSGKLFVSLDTDTFQTRDSDGHWQDAMNLQEMRRDLALHRDSPEAVRLRSAVPALTPTGEERTVAGLPCLVYHGKNPMPPPVDPHPPSTPTSPLQQSTTVITDVWACMTTTLPELDPFRDLLSLIPMKNPFITLLLPLHARILEIPGVPLSLVVTINAQEASSSNRQEVGTTTEQTDWVSREPLDEQLLRPNAFLTVTSTPTTGIPITVIPTDIPTNNKGTTPFARIEPLNTSVNVTAPLLNGTTVFQKWQQDGKDLTTSLTTTLTMNAAHTLTAIYVPAPTLTIMSSTPDNGVTICLSPNDLLDHGSGSTSFTRQYRYGTMVTVTAPKTAGGYTFRKWQQDGQDITNNPTFTQSIIAPHVFTALYGERPQTPQGSPPTHAPSMSAARLAAARTVVQEAVVEAKALRTNQERAALRDLAKAQAKTGDITGAQQTLAAVPDLPDIQNTFFVIQEIAVAQAVAGDISSALRTIATFSPRYPRVQALNDIARAQALRGDFGRALQTAELAGEDWVRSRVLQELLKAQIEAADFAGAIKTARTIPRDSRGFDSQGFEGLEGVIAVLHARNGNLAEALSVARAMQSDTRFFLYPTLAAYRARAGDLAGAIQMAGEIPEGAGFQLRDLTFYGVVLGQVSIGDLASARLTVASIKEPSIKPMVIAAILAGQAKKGDVGGALSEAQALPDVQARTMALDSIAVALARAGNLPGAIGIATAITDTSQRGSTLAKVVEIQANRGDVNGAWTIVGTISNTTMRLLAEKKVALIIARAGDPARLIAIARREFAAYQRVGALCHGVDEILNNTPQVEDIHGLFPLELRP